MQTLQKHILGLPLGLALLVAVAGDAKADALPGNAGRAFYPSDAGCFYQPSWNGIQNGCSGTRPWLIPVQNRWGWSQRAFTAWGGGAPSNQVYCEAYVVMTSTALIWKSGMTQASPGGTVIGQAWAQEYDTLHFVCELRTTSQPLTAVRVHQL